MKIESEKERERENERKNGSGIVDYFYHRFETRVEREKERWDVRDLLREKLEK